MSQKTRADGFINQYGRYFDEHRLKKILHGGKFMIEDSAEGAYIYDTSGKRYLDFFLASGVFTIGHRNPAVINAIFEALESQDIGGVFYFSERKAELAKKLAETTPEGLEISLPAVGGGEANDLALKLAMASNSRSEIICGEKCYHGSAGLTDQLGPRHLREWHGLKSFTVTRVPEGDADAVQDAMTENTAACIFEPIRSLVDGKRPGAEYWRDVRNLCDRNDSKLIIDEVVCGMGRLGSLWGSEVDDIRPDMLISAKGLSGGIYPIAAIVMRPEMLDSWGDVPFRSYSTYAWSNIGVVAASVAIEETIRLLPNALENSATLESELLKIAALYPEHVKDVRRTGMHLVMEFHTDRIGGFEFTDQMYQRGVILHASGAYPDAPGKFMPPLILNADHINECLEKVDDVLASC